MQCYCGTDTSSTIDIHGLLETKGETRCLERVSVYWLLLQAYHECPRHSQHLTKMIDLLQLLNR